jgi:hypothetical protein
MSGVQGAWGRPEIEALVGREARKLESEACGRCGAFTEAHLSDLDGLRLCYDCFVGGNGARRVDLLGESRVDLVELVRKGIPEREYVPGCDGWLIRGKRYMMFARAGMGKSIAALVVAVEVVARGGRVVVLDVENGADEYARRLNDVLGAHDDEVADASQERLAYYEFPALRLDWTPEEWTRSIAGADVVIFDSSRMTLSSVGLSEDVNDDYAQFVNTLVIPLARANSTTPTTPAGQVLRATSTRSPSTSQRSSPSMRRPPGSWSGAGAGSGFPGCRWRWSR